MQYDKRLVTITVVVAVVAAAVALNWSRKVSKKRRDENRKELISRYGGEKIAESLSATAEIIVYRGKPSYPDAYEYKDALFRCHPFAISLASREQTSEIVSVLLDPENFEWHGDSSATPNPDFVMECEMQSGVYRICVDSTYALLMTYHGDDWTGGLRMKKSACRGLVMTLEGLEGWKQLDDVTQQPWRTMPAPE